MELLHALSNFLAYFASAIALFCVFANLYLRLTPYAEIRLIREGNLAAAAALIGSLIGFALPLSSSIANSVGLRDMLAWGLVAMLVQSLVFLAISRLVPELKEGIVAGNLAHGLMLGGCAFCIGLINAACIVY
ncbi:DUF350 domain-containing protein [Pseudomonas sp. LFM046]|uniref:DUF350 domain-containing protein n=1 Tax=Pseudomonas sp. LFM046 TaxID=1608357 RepID=UPI0005CFA559|nr:DUF350 domain-containing protein [Pseudomonas sp. LFM046]